MESVASDEDTSKDQELADALQSVKDSIVYKANNIKSEKRWVKEVTKIIESYVQKARHVNSHIRNEQQSVKVLFRKKKQIENMITQRKLEAKLRIAHKDLETIDSAIKNIDKKAVAFNQSKDHIKNTIGAIHSELSKLRGVHKDELSGHSSSDSDSSSSSSSSVSSSSSSSSTEFSGHSSSDSGSSSSSSHSV